MTHYDTLGVAKDATPDEIKKSYRKLAKELHPDLNDGNDVKFKELSNAYEILKDKDKREQYDFSLQPQPRQHFHYSEQGHPFGFQHGAFDDIIRDMQRRAWDQQQQAQEQNKNIHVHYNISFKDSFDGKRVTLRYSTKSTKNEEITVDIPRSVFDGQKIRYTGLGEKTLPNVPAGDLYITVSVIPDENFIRHDYNVVTATYIDYLQAMIGTEVIVDCIDGGQINLKIKKGQNPGSHLRVADRGFHMPNGKRGDMIVELVIESPVLSDDEIEILKTLKKG